MLYFYLNEIVTPNNRQMIHYIKQSDLNNIDDQDSKQVDINACAFCGQPDDEHCSCVDDLLIEDIEIDDSF
jgi:hypothetical protein